jgi:pantoate--beta-alanine ligase
MEIISEVAALRDRLRQESSVGCVPTMGSIHDGHLSLMGVARQHARLVVATIFVNRLQFGPHDDFDRYPRSFDEDCRKLADAGVDCVFHPDEQQMYPVPQLFQIDPGPIADDLEGRVRPGHFRGVATVVLKLLNIVQPHVAVFGRKDYQQLSLLSQMVAQFALPVRVIGGDTLRADDGLALSSRNRYLDAVERAEAPRLYTTLEHAAQRIGAGERNFAAVEADSGAVLARHGWQVDYVAVRSRGTLAAPDPGERELVVLGAGRLGHTRLLDNVETVAPR